MSNTSKNEKLHIFALTCRELADEFNRRYGKGLYHAAALYREIFKNGTPFFAQAPEFIDAPSLARKVSNDIRIPSSRIVSRQEEDGVVKFATALADDLIIESVIIPANGRTTLCVSSQVGCRMGCTFCMTGEMGLKRNLTAEEIVQQVYTACFTLQYRIDNIVFMGMGEPFDNFDAVMQALCVITDQRGFDIAYSHITVSTAGHVDGILKLADKKIPTLNLAVSLNAADDALRTSLMPINKKYSLSRLKRALKHFCAARKNPVLIEYVLIAQVNDSVEEAEKLASYLEGLPVRVNVIAYNDGSANPYKPPEDAQARRFSQALFDKNIFVRLRQSRGHGIMAACGQLGASLGNREPSNRINR